MIDANQKDTPPRTEMGFHYIKSPLYRTIHCDGVFGGVTPNGHIDASMFSERYPIPTYVKQKLDGMTLGEEIERATRDGIVREIEVGIFMTLEAATLLHAWLGEKIGQLSTARQKLLQSATQ